MQFETSPMGKGKQEEGLLVGARYCRGDQYRSFQLSMEFF